MPAYCAELEKREHDVLAPYAQLSKTLEAEKF